MASLKELFLIQLIAAINAACPLVLAALSAREMFNSLTQFGGRLKAAIFCFTLSMWLLRRAIQPFNATFEEVGWLIFNLTLHYLTTRYCLPIFCRLMRGIDDRSSSQGQSRDLAIGVIYLNELLMIINLAIVSYLWLESSP